MTPEEVRRAHREDFYGALRKNDLEELSQIYSDDYMLVRPDGTVRLPKRKSWMISRPMQ